MEQWYTLHNCLYWFHLPWNYAYLLLTLELPCPCFYFIDYIGLGTHTSLLLCSAVNFTAPPPLHILQRCTPWTGPSSSLPQAPRTLRTRIRMHDAHACVSKPFSIHLPTAASERRARGAVRKEGVRHGGVRHHRADEGAGVVDGRFAGLEALPVVLVQVRALSHASGPVGRYKRPGDDRAAQRRGVLFLVAVEVRVRHVSAVHLCREVPPHPVAGWTASAVAPPLATLTAVAAHSSPVGLPVAQRMQRVPW